MAAKKYTWHKIAESVAELNWNEQGLCEVEAGGKRICLARYKEQVFACAHKCPHAGGHMSKGYLDTLGNIVCPLHRYRFSLQNGRNVSGEGYYLKNYPVELRDDGVYAGIEQSSFFGL